MRPFSRVGSRLFEPVQIVGGPKTRAIVQRPPDIDRPGVEFTYPSLVCRVKRDSLLRTGQVVQLAGGGKYLVTDHSSTIDWVTHHLFNCDRQVTWKRPTVVQDTVTGLDKGSTPAARGTPWVLWEKVRREFTDLNIRVSQETHLMVTGEAMQIDDIVEDMRVMRVNRALGVQIVELQG